LRALPDTFGGCDVQVLRESFVLRLECSWTFLLYEKTLISWFEFYLIFKWFLVNDQRDAQILFYVFISIYNSTCFEHIVLIVRREKFYLYSLW